jgi:uncharacterized protein (DUF433 family)
MIVYNSLVMMTIDSTITAPFSVLEDGTIRITGTRVPLETVVYHFKLGASPEEIALRFPSLPLVDVYCSIAYYLSHREEVEQYMQQQQAAGIETRRLIEASPLHREKSGIRERLLARWSNRQNNC